MVLALSIRHKEAGMDKAAHVWPTAGERRADRRFGWLPLHIIAICFVVLAHVVQGRTAESQVHRAFSHHVVAYIGARLHDAVGQRLAVCAGKVCLALPHTYCRVVLLAPPVERRAQPSLVRRRAVVARPNAAVLLTTVHAEGSLKV